MRSPLTALLARLREDPEAAVELATLACDRLADANQQIESLSWDTVLYRLIRTPIRFGRRAGGAI